MARSVAISPRRSKTDIAIVFITPIAPITMANIDVNHDIVRAIFICVSEFTNSAHGVAAILGSNASICPANLCNRRRPLVRRMDNKARHFSRTVHLPLKLIEQHKYGPVLVDAETLEYSDHFEILSIELHMVARMLAKIRRQDAPQHHLPPVARLQTPTGQEVHAIEHRAIRLPAVHDHHEQIRGLQS